MRIYFKNHHHGRRLINYQRAGGFSLFELIVFIILVAIIYATAANRFAEFPGQAERANFLAVTMQIQTAINTEILLSYSTGRIQNVDAYAGKNPMDLLLRPPSNYIGAFDLVDKSRMPTRTWYFDQPAEELVYLVNDDENTYLTLDGIDIPTDEFRFKIILVYREEDRRSGLPVDLLEEDVQLDESDIRRRLSGALLQPTLPFRWDNVDRDILLANASQQAAAG